MKFVWMLVAVLACQAVARQIEIEGLPEWELADSEVSTNMPLLCAKENARHLLVSLELAGTPSNNVEVAFGRDTNTNGVLEVGEIGLAVGWDCGRWRLRVMREEPGASGDKPGVSCDEWTAEPLTANRVKQLDLDVTVSQTKAKRLEAYENGEALDWVAPQHALEEFFDVSWDTLKLTVRGVDRTDGSLRANLLVAGTAIRIR